MPELALQIGGRSFEVACEPGQEATLTRAAKLLDNEAARVTDAIGVSTDKRMLLLAGLMLADTMSTLEDQAKAAEERARSSDERLRQVEAKNAMMAANALKLETAANSSTPKGEVAELREAHDAARALLSKTLADVKAIVAKS